MSTGFFFKKKSKKNLHKTVTMTREEFFDGRKGAAVVTLTTTDSSKLTVTATAEASRISALLDLQRANHPSKWLEDYRGRGAALRLSVTAESLTRANTTLPFTRHNLTVQLYDRTGGRARYTDISGYTVTFTRQSKTPSPPRQWAPCGFCLGSGHEENKCFKKKNQKILGLGQGTNEELAVQDREGGGPLVQVRSHTKRSAPADVRVCGGQEETVGTDMGRQGVLRGSDKIFEESREGDRGDRGGGGVRKGGWELIMYLKSGEGLAWPGGWTIQPSFHSGMHALVIYHSMNTSNDLLKLKKRY